MRAEGINVALGCWFRFLPWCPQCAIKHEIVHLAPHIMNDHFTAAAPCLTSQRLLHPGRWKVIQPSLSSNTEAAFAVGSEVPLRPNNLVATTSPCS